MEKLQLFFEKMTFPPSLTGKFPVIFEGTGQIEGQNGIINGVFPVSVGKIVESGANYCSFSI